MATRSSTPPPPPFPTTTTSTTTVHHRRHDSSLPEPYQDNHHYNYNDHEEEEDEDDEDEDEDDLEVIGKTSTELAEYDRQVVLQHEEDTEALLVNGGNSSSSTHHYHNNKKGKEAKNVRKEMKNIRKEAKNIIKEEKRQKRKEERASRKRERNPRDAPAEQRELLYQAAHDGSDSDNTDDDQQDSKGSPAGIREYTVLDEKRARKRRRRARCSRFCSQFCKYCIIILFLIVILVAIVLGAYKASDTTKVRNHNKVKPTRLTSNGTALFGPTTIVISFDGFRADFLKRGLTPTLNSFIAQGVSPRYMTPSFPSVTFPNHFTLLTGLYPESHGVVGNTFWDPQLKEEFYYTHPKSSMQAKWWTAEPLWVTAEHQGISTAVHMWPGSEAHIPDVEPTYLDKFNDSEALPRKVDRILGLLDQPGWEKEHVPYDQKRPQLIAAYVPNVDADGHLYGPNSTEIRQTIREADDMVASLLAGLGARNLTDIVNVVIVSDHGMATTDVSRLIQLEDIVDTSLIEHMDGWPHYGLRPKNPADVEMMYDRLRQHANQDGAFQVFLRDKNMPERYHFTQNERIAPLWIFPEAGWAVVTKDEVDVKEAQATGQIYHPRGIHGYDHEHPLMRAIFIARGPAFPHQPGSRVANFQNIQVYNILCDSLGIQPNPNNGTLRLPLQPVGFHDSEDTTGQGDDGEEEENHEISIEYPPPQRPTAPDGGDDRPMTEDEEIEIIISWEEFLKHKYEDLTNWLDGLLGISSHD